MSEIRPFTKEDFEAAIEASGWDLDEIKSFFVCGKQWTGYWYDDSKVYQIPPIYIGSKGSRAYVECPNSIYIRHRNEDYFNWKRPTLEQVQFNFKVGDRVIPQKAASDDGMPGKYVGQIGIVDENGAYWFAQWENIKHAPNEQKPKQPEAPKPKSIQYECTHSAVLQDRYGNEIIIPDPDDSWECVEGHRDFWPYLHVGNFSKQTIIVRTAFDIGAIKKTNLKVIHEPGMMYLNEYVVKARQEALRIVSYKKSRQALPTDFDVASPEYYPGAQMFKKLSLNPAQECEWPKGG